MTCQVTTRQDMCDHITCHQIIGHYCDYKTCPMITGDVLRCLVITPCMTIAHAYSAQAWRLDPLLEIDPGPPRQCPFLILDPGGFVAIIVGSPIQRAKPRSIGRPSCTAATCGALRRANRPSALHASLLLHSSPLERRLLPSYSQKTLGGSHRSTSEVTCPPHIVRLRRRIAF